MSDSELNEVNIQKTKSLIVSGENEVYNIRLHWEQMEQIRIFKYLESIIESNGEDRRRNKWWMGNTGMLLHMIKSTFLGRRRKYLET